MNENTGKKWNEWPFSYPPVNTLALVEFDTARDEWYKGIVLGLGDDADGEFCLFRWVDGPNANKKSYYYEPESFRPLPVIENKEQKDSPKEEKSLDNLLKELHNLKQEEKELSDKIVGIIKDINQILDSCGLAVVYQDDL